MAIALNIDDVFDMAIHIERNGARFYRQAAARDGVPEMTKSLLNELAEMEDDHKDVFVDMKDGHSTEAEMPAFSADRDAVAYLHAMTDGNIIGGEPDENERTASRGSTAEVLRTAIELEKDSIVFYLGFKEILTDTEDKTNIDNVIREEMRHVVDLQTKLEVL